MSRRCGFCEVASPDFYQEEVHPHALSLSVWKAAFVCWAACCQPLCPCCVQLLGVCLSAAGLARVRFQYHPRVICFLVFVFETNIARMMCVYMRNKISCSGFVNSKSTSNAPRLLSRISVWCALRGLRPRRLWIGK